MLHLQEKAHFSLEEFRRGKGSPLTRYNPSSGPITPEADDDELSVLGGKTRLVSKKEPSSPILMDRSPTSMNPVVPLPLSPGLHNQLPQSVREYLDSFKVGSQHQQEQQHQQGLYSDQSFDGSIPNGPHNSYSEDAEMSPVGMYGMSSLSGTSSFQTEPSSFLSQPSMQSMLHTHTAHQQQQQGSSSSNASGSQNDSSYPQYFPVYDYGMSSSAYAGGGATNSMFGGQDHGGSASTTTSPSLMLDTGSGAGGAGSGGGMSRKASGSPDNMHSTWLDFVNNMSAMQ